MNNFDTQISVITNAITKVPFIVAIDGRCAAGKTTLAAQFAKDNVCTVIHADDFFLRPEQRSQTRLQTPGENIDHERLLSEVLLPLKKGLPFSYSPFDCHTQSLKSPITVTPGNITVIEGSYCCHPSLWNYYDYHIFIDIDSSEQLERIKLRNPDRFEVFMSRWIPLEEAYFTAFNVKDKCELVIQ